MIQRVDGVIRAIQGRSVQNGAAAGGARGEFAAELMRLGAGRTGGTFGAASSDTRTDSLRARLGERTTGETAGPGVERDPLGPTRDPREAAGARRPLPGQSQPHTGSAPTVDGDGKPRTAPSADDEPIQLTSRGGYRSEADYIRDQGWTKHPNALYPDPAREGFWIDPVSGRSGNFPTGYVPGMPLGTPGSVAQNDVPPEPQNDPLSVEMTRLGMDSTDSRERLKFIASVDENMRNWLNPILIAQGEEPVAERPLGELSEDLSRRIEERREKREQRAEVLADLAAGNGSVRGGPDQGTVPVFQS